MLRKILSIVAFTLAVAAWCSAAEQEMVWPSLDTIGSVKGRSATRADVAAGNAAFSLEVASGHTIGTPIDIAIPQYAIWHNSQTHSDVPVVVIQAEGRGKASFIGFKFIQGNALGVAPMNEVTMLGTDRSKLPRI